MNKAIIATCGMMTAIFSAFPIYSAERSEYWHQRVSLFEKLPISTEDIVFVGNSITDGGEFSELFSDIRIKNRGINSDDIDGVIDRIDDILKGKPSKIFLLIGINDVSHNLSVDILTKKYSDLVKKIRKASPDTRLYLQSIMPINNDYGRYKNLKDKEDIIVSFNSKIKRLAEDNNACFVDLSQALSLPGTQKLNPEFTNDGLHLNGNGYFAWIESIRKYVFE